MGRFVFPLRREDEDRGTTPRDGARPALTLCASRQGAVPIQTILQKRAEPRLVRAEQFVCRMRGASQPMLLRCSDGCFYVVKFRNNPQHARVLANELFAARLAEMLGLPVGQPAIVDVPRELVKGTQSLWIETGERREVCSPGLQFGSRYPGLPGETQVVDFLPDRHLRRLKNLRQVFLGALVFDKWTCNCDGRQLVFHRGAGDEAYSAVMVDQGFCFNDGEWNFLDSPLRGLYPRRMVYESVRGLNSFEPCLSQIENLGRADLEESVSGIPPEWCEPEPEQLAGLLERLFERRSGLRQAIIEARHCPIQPFPNWEE